MRISCLFLIFICFPFSLSASSTSVDHYFRRLKDLPLNQLTDKGQVCENIAKHQSRDEFPKEDFDILSNVIYGTKKFPIVGELDQVIVDKRTNKVILVVEVKCRHRAGNKARLQLQKFKSFIERSIRHSIINRNHNSIPIFIPSNPSEILSYSQFDQNPRYRAISPTSINMLPFEFVPLDLSESSVNLLLWQLDRHRAQRDRAQSF